MTRERWRAAFGVVMALGLIGGDGPSGKPGRVVLEIGGEVEHPTGLTADDLAAMPRRSVRPRITRGSSRPR